MANFFLGIGLTGFFFCTAFQRRIDEKLATLGKTLRLAWESWRKPRPPPDDLPLVTRLIGSLKAGISLESALLDFSREPEISLAEKTRISSILEGGPQKDFLSSFLQESLRSGVPVVATLQVFQKILQVERRVRVKSVSLTGQSRAQAEVLSWLPWGMFLLISLADREWFLSAATSGLSWFFWALSLLLLAAGRKWMKRLLSAALGPGGKEEVLQEELLPNLTLRILACLSLGKDAESALELAIRESNDERISKAFLECRNESESVNTLRTLLHHGRRTGAPLREDLLAYLSDLYLQTEGRWEERVQKLPVLMMAPLFLCFFPSCLLVICSLFLPLLKEVT